MYTGFSAWVNDMRFRIYKDDKLYNGDVNIKEYVAIQRVVNQIFYPARIISMQQDMKEKRIEYLKKGFKDPQLGKLLDMYRDIVWTKKSGYSDSTVFHLEHGPSNKEEKDILEMTRWDEGTRIHFN